MINPSIHISNNQTEIAPANKDSLKPNNLQGHSVNLLPKSNSAHRIAFYFGAAAMATGLALAAKGYYAPSDIKKDIVNQEILKPDQTPHLITKTVEPITLMETALKIKDSIALNMDKDLGLKVIVYSFGGVTILGIGCGLFLFTAEMLIQCGCIRFGCGGGSE